MTEPSGSSKPSKSSPPARPQWVSRVWPWVLLGMLLHVVLMQSPQEEQTQAVEVRAAGEGSGQRPARSASVLEQWATSQEDLASLEDPEVLDEIGQRALALGLTDRAKAALTLSLERDEINNYEKSFPSSVFAQALLAERLGDFQASQALWNDAFHSDVLKAYFFIAQFSIDPNRDALLTTARQRIEQAVTEVRAGGSPHIYTTSKGESRALTMATLEDAKAAFAEGKPLRYVYIERLDLTDEAYDGAVSCMRCVVGSLEAPGATFADRLHFTGIVLGDLHLGRKKEGDVVRSAAASINTLFLENSVVFGNLNMDSVSIEGRVANLPMVVVEGSADLRNINVFGTLDMRYAWIRGNLNLKEATFGGAGYFGHLTVGSMNAVRIATSQQPLLFNSAHFMGPVTFERSDIARGATFENARFNGDFHLSHCRFYDRLNLSRARFAGRAQLTHLELTDLDAYGVQVAGDADFSDSVVKGSARFSVDALARRQYRLDPSPLHRLYKQYQGDIDADKDLTTSSQYGVLHVDDLSASFKKDVSFANTIFEKFVSFEGVHFGNTSQTKQTANFYNTQFFGEAHFEDTVFIANADFRTIFGNELSFNRALFYSHWMLDDANIPGRVSMSDARLVENATLSMYGARINSIGVNLNQIYDEKTKTSRLFYQRCAETNDALPAELLADPRLDEARWDSQREVVVSDAAVIERRSRELCYARTVGEFVVLRDSFNKRGMSQENDWAYWNVRHHINRQQRVLSESTWENMKGWGEWLLFEQGFGWGVRLGNLAWTSLVVILLFAVMYRVLCAEAFINWDDQKVLMKSLPIWAFVLMSFHIFLGRPRDWRSQVSSTLWKMFYVTEISIGIIITTFFIGAYTRMVLR